MPDRLTPLERTVIALARTDPAWSIERQGVIARWFYGRDQRPLPLANARLEALRRYAILRRVHGRALAQEEGERLREAGFCRLQMAEADALVAARPVERRPRPPTDLSKPGDGILSRGRPSHPRHPMRIAAHV